MSLTDTQKLEMLALWLDGKYPHDAAPEVQTDLRRIAANLTSLTQRLQEVEAERDQAYKQAAAWKQMCESVCDDRDRQLESYNRVNELWGSEQRTRIRQDKELARYRTALANDQIIPYANDIKDSNMDERMSMEEFVAAVLRRVRPAAEHGFQSSK